MRRSYWGFVVGAVLAAIWISFGFMNLILIIIAGLLGYIAASLTGSKEDLEGFRSQVNRVLKQDK
ncbi:hypothetical protein [Latilactobacillus curvatus]|uniref:hypothetical protein n=1 Tax=Latilactobacillus curvatus TaxID=28038 RepID=UPI0009770D51|nr:hypothetical protein [Latilactobacillus curvatus]MCM6844760.1 hypothetical protein [Latilactobacillus curvatus]MCM6860346.1 hypothetical protein [Latilactobacillus curvatus]MCM6867643.1 hypothetical protein [Latilactobacillus curvatus]MCP8859829.1 hypothetical protein [Latilactobacillus curvatus]MCP8861629.1 hypothetical protein [Latilactobacillus curvatus]